MGSNIQKLNFYVIMDKAWVKILLDIVSVFNMVSSISREKQHVKLNQEGIEVIREYYPQKEEGVTLECAWETDKFVLLERIDKGKIETQDKDLGGDNSLGASTIHYQTIEAFLGDDEPPPKKAHTSCAVKCGQTQIISLETDSLTDPSVKQGDVKQVEDCTGGEDVLGTAGSPTRKMVPDGGLFASSSPSSNPPKLKTRSRNNVAFIPVRVPATSTKDVKGLHGMGSRSRSTPSGEEDPFFNLLTGVNLKDSIF